MPPPRDQPARRATNASGVSNSRPGPSAATSRPGVRQPTKRASTARHQLTTSSSFSSSTSARFGRPGAVSPAESLRSVATSASTVTGTKRKERDFESGILSSSADSNGPVTVSAADETNINVVVRCRGRNEREVRENSAVVVNTDGAKGKIVELMMGPNALSNKTYNFDRVFSPAADQSMIFDDVVKPILDEMLAGFNCTIFAYGQTGTGKTYTMSGDMRETLGLLTDAAGIIPRVLQSLFNTLERDEADSVVRCSFIELYNEELRDLLSPDGDGGASSGASTNNKLKIYDDNSRKGHATTVVQGMEECHIASAADGIKRLQEGSLRRQVAATKCNDLSSRSHTVFTITVHTKHQVDGGEVFYTTGKLNLVDLAGSENIQRSGAENKRAAEAGLINKSLLTLGRVINALVDRTAHVPYRESKLTRLLQDSLGGRTKTCIIATISTAKSNLEETISTLDYAFRAKNIRNKPQVNQLVNKKTLLREFTAEIEKLKSELIVTRQRNGVYLANDAYEEMTVQSESRRILAEEQAAKIETMENNLRNKLQELLDLTANFMGLKKEHEATKARLDGTQGVLDHTELVLTATRKSLAEETYVRQAHQSTETALARIGSELMATVHRTVRDIEGLRAKNRRKSDLQGVNRNAWAGSQAQVAEVTRLVEGRVRDLRAAQDEHIDRIATRMQAFARTELESLGAAQALIDTKLAAFDASRDALVAQHGAAHEELDTLLGEVRAIRDHLRARVGASLQTIASAAEHIAEDVVSELDAFHNQLHGSYSTLGQDVKTLFETLLEHMHAQRAESDALRQQVNAASQAVEQANAAVAAQVQDAVDEERRLAAADQEQLLAQIGALVAAQAEAQAARRAARAEGLRTRVAASHEAFAGDVAAYAAGMDAWNARGDGFVRDASQTRDALRARLQEDWAVARDRSTAIQATARSVHEATVRVVGEQRSDLDEQMQGLDQLVAQAAARGAAQHAAHGASVSSMAEVVASTLATLSASATAATQRATEAADDAAAAAGTLRSQWVPAETTLCEPLDHLRACVASTSLREYVPTGDTPEKVQYPTVRELPRTAQHHVLLAKMHKEEARQGEQDGGDDNDDENDNGDGVDDVNDVDDADAAQEAMASTPSKGPSAVFHDGADDDGGGGGLDGANADTLLGRSTRLREVNPNVTAMGPPALLFEAGTRAMSFVGVKQEEEEAAVAAAAGEGRTTADADGYGADGGNQAVAPFRRSRRQTGGQGLAGGAGAGEPPQKYAKTGAATVRSSMLLALGGRENVPPAASAFSQSLSRRRSPRLN